MSDNIFKQIKEKAKIRAEYHSKVLKQTEKVRDIEKDKRARIKKLKLLAVEFESLFQDEKYPQYIEFIQSTIIALKEGAESSLLSGDERRALILASQSHILEQIKNYPVEVVKELEASEK